MQSQKKYKRIVIKIGSSLFYSKEAKLDANLISSLAKEIAQLMKEGREVVIVSSGAIALGMSILKIEERPKNLSLLQAAAAIGQHELMDAYRRFFKEVSLSCARGAVPRRFPAGSIALSTILGAKRYKRGWPQAIAGIPRSRKRTIWKRLKAIEGVTRLVASAGKKIAARRPALSKGS